MALDSFAASATAVLVAAQRITTTTNGTGVDLQALDLANRQGIAVLSVGAVSSLTSLDVKIQGSADNAAWSDLSPAVAFTQLTAVGNESIRFHNPSDHRYVRAVLTLSGTHVEVSVQIIFADAKQQ